MQFTFALISGIKSKKYKRNFKSKLSKHLVYFLMQPQSLWVKWHQYILLLTRVSVQDEMKSII